ncbi:hypothetical protein CEUSTIGMA_g2897.t1 [Chlamydomonas eustigma]|uniref:Uncharacterized protein n=1 Tax=Chlamydomonas eustigma TaxID=1157962 RepID=A0A250WX99_9CHLO|nr:hypothetical protein CEUSTIGMA_g2897.t1 [Chlamydomonas eustigma]|eukprot:GAX75454.1 hypothetical protein CEUSTIGMA_g2897.t1 [Chlamydomonas eustigma]
MKTAERCAKASSLWIVQATYVTDGSQFPTSFCKAVGKSRVTSSKLINRHCLKLAGATCLLLLAVLTVTTVDKQHLHIHSQASCHHPSGNHGPSTKEVKWLLHASQPCMAQPVSDILKPILLILDASREGCRYSSNGYVHDGNVDPILKPRHNSSNDADPLPWKQLELPDSIVASRCAWKALGVAEIARMRMQKDIDDVTSLNTVQQQQGQQKAKAGNEEKIKYPLFSMEPAERLLSGLEAYSLLDLFFSHMLSQERGPTVLPYELQRPEVQPLLNLLQHVWLARSTSKGDSQRASPAAVPLDHCSTDSGSALMLVVAKAVKELSHASCKEHHIHSGAAASPPTPSSLPYVLMRRLTLAVLQLLYASDQTDSTACRVAVDAVLSDILTAFSEASKCTKSARKVMEFYHISKAGGTSMCQLAADSNLKNPGFDTDTNCIVFRSVDGPHWTRIAPNQSNMKAWAAITPRLYCRHAHSTGPGQHPLPAAASPWSCLHRNAFLFAKGVTFYANEGSLHSVYEKNSNYGSSEVCHEMDSVIVLRDGVERARSHVGEVVKVYNKFAEDHGPLYLPPKDIQQWKEFAPAAVDNYMTRTLLGPGPMHCREFGTIGESELLTASLALSSMDHILILGDEDHGDVVMRAGMGWKSALRGKRWRWSNINIEENLGFQPGTMRLLEDWNRIDNLLVAWGRALLRLDTAFLIGVAALNGNLLPLTPEEINRKSKPALALSLMTQQKLSKACNQTASEGRSIQHLNSIVSLDGFTVNCSSGYIHVSDGSRSHKEAAAGDANVLMLSHKIIPPWSLVQKVAEGLSSGIATDSLSEASVHTQWHGSTTSGLDIEAGHHLGLSMKILLPLS